MSKWLHLVWKYGASVLRSIVLAHTKNHLKCDGFLKAHNRMVYMWTNLHSQSQDALFSLH